MKKSGTVNKAVLTRLRTMLGPEPKGRIVRGISWSVDIDTAVSLYIQEVNADLPAGTQRLDRSGLVQLAMSEFLGLPAPKVSTPPTNQPAYMPLGELEPA